MDGCSDADARVVRLSPLATTWSSGGASSRVAVTKWGPSLTVCGGHRHVRRFPADRAGVAAGRRKEASRRAPLPRAQPPVRPRTSPT
jgi:hypothetical protein